MERRLAMLSYDSPYTPPQSQNYQQSATASSNATQATITKVETKSQPTQQAQAPEEVKKEAP